MNKLSALMIGAAMVLGTAFAAQNAPKTAEKPAAQLATDREIEKFPFGAKGDADVQVLSVDRMFE